MRIVIITLLFLSLLYNKVCCQIVPANRSYLNYTQVMFEYPEIKKASYYVLQLAEYTPISNFDLSIFKEQIDSTTATLITGLQFGKRYQWRYIAYNDEKKIIYKSNIFYFEVLFNKYVDKSKYRAKVTTNNQKQGYIFLDENRIAIDRKGSPVWFLPANYKNIQNIRMTNSGTITFMANQEGKYFSCYEVNLDGKILWESPKNGKISGDNTEYFHNDFQKLKNGNYLTIGYKFVNPKISIDAQKIAFSTLIEYDKNKNIVWSWISGDYFKDIDTYFNPNNNKKHIWSVDTVSIYEPFYINSFLVDEEQDLIYANIKSNSSIVKIQKSTGKVLCNYGNKFVSVGNNYANVLFTNPSNFVLLKNKNIAIYHKNYNLNIDTNITKKFISSNIVVISQPQNEKDSVNKVWEYKSDIDSITYDPLYKSGNIVLLKNSNFLLNTGELTNRIFEITSEKEIEWDCFTEKYSEDNKAFTPLLINTISYTESLYPVYFTIKNYNQIH